MNSAGRCTLTPRQDEQARCDIYAAPASAWQFEESMVWGLSEWAECVPPNRQVRGLPIHSLSNADTVSEGRRLMRESRTFRS